MTSKKPVGSRPRTRRYDTEPASLRPCRYHKTDQTDVTIRVSGEFDDEVVRNQVKYMGLVEILRIRKAGFAYRGEFQQFLARYKCLCPDTWPDWNRRYTAAAAVCRLIRSLGFADDDYRIGKYGVHCIARRNHTT